MIRNAKIGQVKGPFSANVDLLNNDAAIGLFTPQTQKPVLYKLGIQTTQGTVVKINGVEITIGVTGIYELDDIIKINSLIFPSGADEDTIIDFVYIGTPN